MCAIYHIFIYSVMQVGVEELALDYYASAQGGGWRGMHCEGGVWATLFGLLLCVFQQQLGSGKCSFVGGTLYPMALHLHCCVIPALGILLQ